MTWLTDWDDLIHGTALFGAAIPFVVTFGLGWKLPCRWSWAALWLGLLIPAWWLFGLPKVPPDSSEDFVVSVLVAAALALASIQNHRINLAVILMFIGIIVWMIYPAWLAEAGGAKRKILITGSIVLTTGLAATLGAFASRQESNQGIALIAFVPPLVGLAVLLQLGGAARFGQAAGACAACLTAVSVLRWRKRVPLSPTIPGMGCGLFVVLAWSGWLFAEVRYGMAALLLLAPVAAWLIRFLPLPKRHPMAGAGWDLVASTVVSAPIAILAILTHLEEMKEFEGY